MRTLLFVIGGFFVFFLLLLTTQRSDKAALARTSLIFLGGWFIVAAGNMWYEVTQAGQTVADELRIALLIFGLPAIPAVVVWVKNRQR